LQTLAAGVLGAEGLPPQEAAIVAEMIAARWADTRGVTQVVFKPDWKSHGKAAPFKRNDKMLETMPQGLIATPGSGITENIVDKARKLGIRIKRIGA
jgi:hypothetical protein